MDIYEQLEEILAYAVTSAAGLPTEPKYYGELRLMEMAEHIARVLHVSDEKYARLHPFIDYVSENKMLSMTDVPAFEQMVQDSVLKLLDCM